MKRYRPRPRQRGPLCRVGNCSGKKRRLVPHVYSPSPSRIYVMPVVYKPPQRKIAKKTTKKQCRPAACCVLSWADVVMKHLLSVCECVCGRVDALCLCVCVDCVDSDIVVRTNTTPFAPSCSLPIGSLFPRRPRKMWRVNAEGEGDGMGWGGGEGGWDLG